MIKVRAAILFLILMLGMNIFAEAHAEKEIFIIFQDGKRIGVETYEISRIGDNIVACGNTKLSLPKFELDQQTTLRLDMNLRPLGFSVKALVNGQAANSSFHFGDKVVTIQSETGGKKTKQEMPNHENMVFIANNAFHHMNILVMKYDLEKGAEQEFVTLPSVDTKIEYEGDDKFRLKGSTLLLKRLFVKMGDNTTLNIWIDGKKRIVKMTYPQQKIDVLLGGYEGISAEK